MKVDLKLNEETQSVREAATALASLGWKVLPLHGMTGNKCSCENPHCHSPAKHPATMHGVKDASLEIAKIDHWFGHGCNANVGIATGQASGLFVLDIDPCHGGDDSFERLCEEHGELPPTPTGCTGGDGTHYYFRLPDETRIANSAGKLGSGLDVRGDGGYVVAPPSTHASSKRYRWAPGRAPNEVPLAHPPEWLVKLICDKPSLADHGPFPGDWAGIIENGVSKGSRNTTFARLAGHLLGKKLAPSEVFAILKLVNQRNQPPLSMLELKAIVISITRRHLKARGL
ncbi:bifunctional DNA primase/polymerase [Ralstonia pseudosolanacearum]|uniref:bifunctional DNA primase/polymerase n=3 Tax=Ralstonia pseudosolanacearum TaxID=1310165 RepID=UPI0012692E64|nr:bifunctional DNA primase/polymerase [Ralstonia pseudosolanacearum]NKF74096.1 hypothetical protein [Ralstonia solanacearum]MCK4150384.1 DNA primase [Ralstonia pseudosolanacearum]BCL86236.1 hypothetical protein MAFF211471_13190 [Ralstonia solanacearum]BCM98785.1 hypothetical protein RPSA_13220 [Ralstonia solanacearum]BEU51113.1 hypothetical protein MAFF211520_14050 [Ralstonia pseudosolanacearum]